VSHSSLATQVSQLARRSILRTLRQPSQIFPSTIFPLFLLAVNSAGLDKAVNIPGFPADTYLAFALAIPFIQSAIFSTMNAGTDLAADIETGFMNRLALTPLRGAALLAGNLAGVVVLATFQALVFVGVGLITGVHFQSGVGGVVVLVLLGALYGLSFGTLGAYIALRSGSGEAVQGMFPLFFVFLFLSSMALPRNLIQQDWFQTVATINPVSYLIEAIRSLVITGWDGQALAQGVVIAVAIGAVGMTAAVFSLKTRLVRT
jgi:ABC-2 type transport system permease protein